jgi:hypothetical protein
VRPFSAGVIEKNCVSLGFPNGRELDRPWTVQAKEQAARLTVSHQDSLATRKCSKFELILLAKDFDHIFSQVFQIAYLLSTAQHSSRTLLLGAQ